ncbi:hypothetical protein H920_06308 [Fukomys damarensis]|uniref:Uncharacterized protein n=1 Tax=Fukomys damarensis TaxID=885580 RepID=A0A091EAS2_FUKDA|nr:hypothetical protein H920_06308 [Fukomys damarensis]
MEDHSVRGCGENSGSSAPPASHALCVTKHFDRMSTTHSEHTTAHHGVMTEAFIPTSATQALDRFGPPRLPRARKC